MKFLYDNFDLLFDEAGSVDAFKKLILYMAVRGKLVPQDPSDEPASLLIEKIKNEKESLIEEGLIKKEKPMPPIKEIEIPYVLPDGWEWVRLKGLGLTQTGTTPPTNINAYYNGDVPFIKPADISQDGINYSNESLSNIGAIKGRIIQKDSVMMVCIGGSIGKTFFIDRDASCNQQINTITGFNNVSGKFINYFISASYFQQNIVKNASGSATPIINKEKWGNLLFPLPPINEQKRIVKKIDEIYEMIPQLKEAFEKRTKYKRQLNQTSLYRLANASSGDDFVSSMQFVTNNFDSLYDNIENVKELRQVILTLAVQGKLAPQDPNDEPASVLLEKIQKEKERLIKERIIKREKELLPISVDEIPFDLPVNWEWARIGDLCWKVTDGTHHTPTYIQDGVPFLSVKDISGGVIDFSNCKFISQEEHDLLTMRCNPGYGDILLTKVGTTGIAKVVDTKNSFSIFVSVALLKLFPPLIHNYYLEYAINSPVVKKQSAKNTRGIGNKNLVLVHIKNMIIPIPPHSEQKRIIEYLNMYMNICDDLEVGLHKNEHLITQLLHTLCFV